MKIALQKLGLVFKAEVDEVPFSRINYFYGQMGAGKSSIARLVDFCLGGTFELTPALQSEFVAATLHLSINSKNLALERKKGSNLVQASWNIGEDYYNLILPARDADGVVLPNTKVEVVSDLIFHLADRQPPRVRKSKIKDDSELSRLSFRDLLWYCYLDQDSFDSNFFNLDNPNDSIKLKSRDVVRFILGFHQEEISELESELQLIHSERNNLIGAAKSLDEVLKEAGVDSEEEINNRVSLLSQQLQEIDLKIKNIRNEDQVPHGADSLRQQGRQLTSELEALEDAIPLVESSIDKDQRHINEITTLKVKVQRGSVARSVLGGVVFVACPRCAQTLPDRSENQCRVCGQEEPAIGTKNIDPEVLEQDARSRISELEDSIVRQKKQLKQMERRQQDLLQKKINTDQALSRLMAEYDSAYLSAALTLEREKAEIGQQIADLKRLIILPKKVIELQKQASNLLSDAAEVKRKLEEARKGAEADLGSLRRLEELFLDCLIRARVPGVSSKNQVSISQRDFLPKVYEPESSDITVTTFSNLSSGGKKTLFKACYALAIHRLAAEINALLPTFLIIDSPMKNISERENVEQFIGFHTLLYQLMEDELENSQLILIDKEYFAPAENSPLEVQVRHMMPGSKENPPLIRYYIDRL